MVLEIFSAQIILMIWHTKRVLTCGNYNILPSKFQAFLKADNSAHVFSFHYWQAAWKPWLCAFSVLPLYPRALSSHFTSNTFFIWWHATCDPLWPEHSSFESSPLSAFFPRSFSNHSAAASSLQIQPGGERHYFTSYTIYNTNAGSELGIFFNFFFF